MKLSELKEGQSAVIVRVAGHGGFRKRIMEMGFVRGQQVRSVLNSPLKDPVKYSVMGYDVSLRRAEAAMIEVLPPDDANRLHLESVSTFGCDTSCEQCSIASCARKQSKTMLRNEINVALVGNPNSGKTSLFNALSGSSEHVGNYSGVTVEAKWTRFSYRGYRINLTDLPGTYSLAAYTPEEVYVREHLYEKMPDVIVNAVVASNLERNLYLTTELIDLNQRTVVALNMYDELESSGAKFDYQQFGAMIGIPIIPTIAKSGYGLEQLLDTIIELFEGRNKVVRHVHINYGALLEEEIRRLSEVIRSSEQAPSQFPIRYWAAKLIEGDAQVATLLSGCESLGQWQGLAQESAVKVQRRLNNDVETLISDYKYGFIAGALEETLSEGGVDINRRSRRIDRLVANKWLGFPIFILLVWLMFYSTFALGAYPQGWIEEGFGALGKWLWRIMPDGALRDLVVNGIVGGVGSVAVFLPNILILYLFISLMEDSGYMARAAFIMDRLMHRMGLHGKSFIPLIMGFGCNVPAIMATRTIESRSSRLITILVTPFMSCSARLPVYILLAGAFFPNHAATVLIGLYLLGLLVAFTTARLLRATKFQKDETPFVMELPPYRWPTFRATMRHMWDKCSQYVRKIGTTILLATVVIWFFSYYPRPEVVTVPAVDGVEQVQEDVHGNSYMARIGKLIEPAMRPLGLDWRAGMALVTSIPAKELVVSTMAVLYGGDDSSSLSENISAKSGMTPSSALAFMIFILLFFPCIATLSTIRSETGSSGWMWFTIIYNTGVAWLLAWLAYLVF